MKALRPAKPRTPGGICRRRRHGLAFLHGYPTVRLFANGSGGNVAARSLKEQVMSRAGAKSLPQLSLRIDLGSEDRIGPGKIQLLENIREHGSISAAGRAMDMSYKRAWDLVDEINRICGHAVVEPQTGGKNGGGALLTPFGTALVARYRKIERDAARAVRRE